MTLADVLRLLDDASYRRNAAMRCCKPQVRDFWLKEFENYPKTFRLEAIAPIEDKVGAFVTDPVLRAILLSGPSLGFLVRAVCPHTIPVPPMTRHCGLIGENVTLSVLAKLASRAAAA